MFISHLTLLDHILDKCSSWSTYENVTFIKLEYYPDLSPAHRTVSHSAYFLLLRNPFPEGSFISLFSSPVIFYVVAWTISLVSGKIQIKTITKYHAIPTRMALIVLKKITDICVDVLLKYVNYHCGEIWASIWFHN